MKVIVVTKRQLDAGYRVFRRDAIPNVLRRNYVVVEGPRADGTYVVEQPPTPKANP